MKTVHAVRRLFVAHLVSNDKALVNSVGQVRNETGYEKLSVFRIAKKTRRREVSFVGPPSAPPLKFPQIRIVFQFSVHLMPTYVHNRGCTMHIMHRVR